MLNTFSGLLPLSQCLLQLDKCPQSRINASQGIRLVPARRSPEPAGDPSLPCAQRISGPLSRILPVLDILTINVPDTMHTATVHPDEQQSGDGTRGRTTCSSCRAVRAGAGR